MIDRVHDAEIRAAAFDWLASKAVEGDVLGREMLAQGFSFRGTRVPLLGPQGIFKPQVLQLPLSITTAPNGPYADSFGDDGLLRYKYRGVDPQHPDNRGLRQLMALNLPLIYFHGLSPGRYMAAWPTFIVADDPASLTFTVAIDDIASIRFDDSEQRVSDYSAIRRAYVTANVKVRVHQRAFRERVLRAYRDRCALCRFRHREMLDAAHIMEDSTPEGEPLVTNGLALCTLHHAAFDRKFIGIRPDYVVEVRPDLLREIDGPTLVGIQSLHHATINVPRQMSDRPDPQLLEQRFERLLKSWAA